MKLILKLIFRDAWYHRGRIGLAVLATVAMSCMIVWLVGSIGLMMLRFDQDAENYLGHYQLAMIPSQEPGAVLPTFPGEMRNDKLVMRIDGARQIRNIMGKMENEQDDQAALRRQRSTTGTPVSSPTIIGIDTTESPFELKEGRWFKDDKISSESISSEKEPGAVLPIFEGVMGTAAAASLRPWGDETATPVGVGDSVVCRVGEKETKIKIVGLVEQKLASGGMGGGVNPAVGAVFVSMNTADHLAGTPLAGTPLAGTPRTEHGAPAQYDYYYVRLMDGVNPKKFAETWSRHFASNNVSVRFIDVDQIQEGLNQTRSRGTGGLVGGAASMNSIIIFSTLVSILIVFTALSMGIGERARVFAMLRTVGMSRRRIAMLVFGESVILCLLGWVGGMFAGWCVLQLTVWLQPQIYGHGKWVSLGMQAVTTAGIAALVGSLLSAIVPAWLATRISPLEGMNRGYVQTVRKGWFVFFGVVGAILLTINPIIAYSDGIAKGAELRQFLYTWIGLPTQLLGLALLAPAVILLVEKLFAAPVAKLLSVPKELLASQLSSNLWRTLGTTVALCIGLGVYSFLEICGYSMLVPFTHSKTLPNTLVTFLPKGIPFDKIDDVKTMPGVDSKRFLPIAIDQSMFSQRQSQRFQSNGLSEMQSSAVVFGIDIAEAFEKPADGGKPLIQVDFREGTLDAALEKLKTGGRYCLVPDSFAFRAGVHVGDKLDLVLPEEGRGARGEGRGRPGGPPGGGRGRRPPNEPGAVLPTSEQIVQYEICGVVSINGWLWMNKISGVRKRGYRSGAMLLAPYESVKNDYKLTDAAYFWFDRTLDKSGKPTVSDKDLEISLQNLADRFYGQNPRTGPVVPQRSSDQRERVDSPERELPEAWTAGPSRPMVKVNSREYLTDRVNSRADSVIQAAAKMPLILLAISSFGMMGTIAASIRSRRFELGVLRSLGVTRFGLIRLILAESLLICIAVILLSVGFGVIGGWCFIGLMKYLSVFGGFTSPLTIPVYWLSIGLLTTLGLCTLAAIFPAVAAGRTEPSKLLQER